MLNYKRKHIVITKNSNNKYSCYNSVFKAFAVLLQLCSTDGRLTNELSICVSSERK